MARPLRAALVGSETALGREIRDLVETSTPILELRLISGEEESAGTLTAVGGEAAITLGLNAASLDGVNAIFLAGSPAANRKALDLADLEPEAAIVDVTGMAEDRPDARLRAPSVEEMEASAGRVQVIAHPAAIALALFLRRLQSAYSMQRAVVVMFAPASEHGMDGVDELQGQTVSLLSFKGLPKKMFDAQLGFSLLARYGEEAPRPLEQVELTIERHLATLLEMPGDGAGAPMPSLRLIQAPVFHGYSFSIWVEFEESPAVDALENALENDVIDVRSGEAEPPNNVGQAGQGGISIGAIAGDRNHASACWFWVVADNLRLAAENAVAVARRLG